MLKTVKVGNKNFADYKAVIGNSEFAAIKKLARQFKGARILHVNATSRGGGVAQILHSQVPMMRSLGIDTQWKLIAPKDFDFFSATKKIHNSLQGHAQTLSRSEWALYDKENQGFAEGFDEAKWDYIIIHDPQPAAMLSYLQKNKAKWIWRCHIDLSDPNPKAAEHFRTYLQGYDAAIYTLQQYVLEGSNITNNGVIPVAIDPLTLKNKPLRPRDARMQLLAHGVDISKPLIVQISRFDPWKDPLGVVEAWEMACEVIPDLQLVLMGDAADDDPEGKNVLEQVMRQVRGKANVFIITDTNDEAVNAFQALANVVIQKSIREGFGLTVTEALWKSTPVIGGNVGGIPEQIKNGKNGYLVKSPSEAARYIVKLVRDPTLTRAMGQWGHEYVREHFLLPHMIKADLKFLQSL